MLDVNEIHVPQPMLEQCGDCHKQDRGAAGQYDHGKWEFIAARDDPPENDKRGRSEDRGNLPALTIDLDVEGCHGAICCSNPFRGWSSRGIRVPGLGRWALFTHREANPREHCSDEAEAEDYLDWYHRKLPSRTRWLTLSKLVIITAPGTLGCQSITPVFWI